jgi:two-component system invasion response regulator UvrY
MIKILVADDHPVVRHGLRQILSDDADMFVADEASNGEEVLDKIKQDDFNVILLDITMPNTNVLDVIAQLRAQRPELGIVVLSVHPEEQYAARMFKAGASGYLQKESTPDELIAAIRKVNAGRKYISTSLAERLAFDLMTQPAKLQHDMLSNREFTIMCMLASGKRLREIASQLSISPKTVSSYRKRILDKMNMKNNIELNAYARENGLLLL